MPMGCTGASVLVDTQAMSVKIVFLGTLVKTVMVIMLDETLFGIGAFHFYNCSIYIFPLVNCT